MEDLNLIMEIELPVTDVAKKKKEKVNCLAEILREFMDEMGLRDADMVRGSGMAWSSYHGWVVEDVATQLCDLNLLKLWQFMNKFKKIHLEYLVYGIGDMEDLEEEKHAS